MPAYARVVVDVRPAHLDRPFDYAVPDGVFVGVGQRVRVPFAGRRRTGWVVGTTDEPETAVGRIKPIALVQGDARWFDEADLRLYRWVADRWAGTLADVLRHAMPERVAAVEAEAASWQPPGVIEPADKAPCPAGAWKPYQCSALLKAVASVDPGDPPPAFWWRPLPGDDVAAMAADLVARTLSAGRTALVLAPDPASPALEAALAVAGPAGADLRGDRSERDRYRAFLAMRSGHARVVVGERGAALAPCPNLGLVLVDDEANPAYKERRSPRHQARDAALARARFAGATAVLLGDLPSAALWRLLSEGHVAAVRAHRPTERERAPRVDVADLSGPQPGGRARLTNVASRRLTEAMAAGRAAVVLAARGGQGAALVCTGCGSRLACPVCDGSIRPVREPDGSSGGAGQAPGRECPACGWSGLQHPCPDCGDDRTSPLAAGAGRLAQELSRSYPEADVARMEGFDAAGPSGRPAIGVMTRGSVVSRPRWLLGDRADLLVIPDADAMRARPALEAAEDALRLWMAAAREADRVVVQTREAGDAAVQALVRWDPDGFWRREAEWRGELGYPPARSLVRVTARAEGVAVGQALGESLPGGDEVLGPDQDGVLLVKSAAIWATLAALRPLREAWDRDGRGVRIDVDPVVAG